MACPLWQSIRRCHRKQTQLDCFAGEELVNPRLVAISGPLGGTVRAVKDDPLSLGRDAAKQDMIGDSAISRKHCAISRVSQDTYEIVDLESRNGTFVNGIQISRTPIRHGDRIRIRTSEFLFLTDQ